jgi:putative intracellular protease/amidase
MTSASLPVAVPVEDGFEDDELHKIMALYVDRPVVEDRGVITARKADDVAAFADTILRAIRRSR